MMKELICVVIKTYIALEIYGVLSIGVSGLVL
jgi:hypothetical protein